MTTGQRNVKLSILMPTIPERAGMCVKLYNEVQCQITAINRNDDVEILVSESKKFLDGGPSIGAKRHSLVKRAQGEYLLFLDDDEGIAGNYLEVILKLCETGADVCTFRSIAKLEQYWTVIDMSLLHEENEQASPDRIVKRKPWHINAIRSDIAKQFCFEDINYGEDWKWMEQVLTKCYKEAHTDAIIHEYRHGKHSEADKITEHEKLQSIQGATSNT